MRLDILKAAGIAGLFALGAVVPTATAQTAPGHDLCACYVNCEKFYGSNPTSLAACMADCDSRFPGQLCLVDYGQADANRPD